MKQLICCRLYDILDYGDDDPWSLDYLIATYGGSINKEQLDKMKLKMSFLKKFFYNNTPKIGGLKFII
jgi:hypothetical protein